MRPANNSQPLFNKNSTNRHLVTSVSHVDDTNHGFANLEFMNLGCLDSLNCESENANSILPPLPPRHLSLNSLSNSTLSNSVQSSVPLLPVVVCNNSYMNKNAESWKLPFPKQYRKEVKKKKQKQKLKNSHTTVSKVTTGHPVLLLPDGKTTRSKVPQPQRGKKRRKKEKSILSVQWKNVHAFDFPCVFCVQNMSIAITDKFWQLKNKKGIEEDLLTRMTEIGNGHPETNTQLEGIIAYYRAKLKSLQAKGTEQVQKIRYLCMSAFKTHFDSGQHSSLRTKENLRKCIYAGCGKVSQSWYNYVAHIARHNQQLYPWHCRVLVGDPKKDQKLRPFINDRLICSHTSSTKDNLKKHIKATHNVRNIICESTVTDEFKLCDTMADDDVVQNILQAMVDDGCFDMDNDNDKDMIVVSELKARGLLERSNQSSRFLLLPEPASNIFETISANVKTKQESAPVSPFLGLASDFMCRYNSDLPQPLPFSFPNHAVSEWTASGIPKLKPKPENQTCNNNIISVPSSSTGASFGEYQTLLDKNISLPSCNPLNDTFTFANMNNFSGITPNEFNFGLPGSQMQGEGVPVYNNLFVNNVYQQPPNAIGPFIGQTNVMNVNLSLNQTIIAPQIMLPPITNSLVYGSQGNTQDARVDDNQLSMQTPCNMLGPFVVPDSPFS